MPKIRTPEETPQRRAARLYHGQRTLFRQALAAVEDMPGEDDTRRWVREALLARVRLHFGNIGRGLTAKIGCHFLAACPKQPLENEHAVPLNLIHNRILGIMPNGDLDPAVKDEYDTPDAIETFITRFVIGVGVTRGKHAALNQHFMASMPPGWDWPDDWPNWHILTDAGCTHFEQLKADWGAAPRPDWLRTLMGRYESLPHPDGPITYFPTCRCNDCAPPAEETVKTA